MAEDNKKLIVEKLMKLIKQTREGKAIENIAYKKGDGDDEFVYIYFLNGYTKKIDVTADSGIAMMRDILERIR